MLMEIHVFLFGEDTYKYSIMKHIRIFFSKKYLGFYASISLSPAVVDYADREGRAPRAPRSGRPLRDDGVRPVSAARAGAAECNGDVLSARRVHAENPPHQGSPQDPARGVAASSTWR